MTHTIQGKKKSFEFHLNKFSLYIPETHPQIPETKIKAAKRVTFTENNITIVDVYKVTL